MKKLAKDYSRKNRIKSISRRDKKQAKGREKFTKMEKLDIESIKKWHQKSAQSNLLYKQQYNKFNDHHSDNCIY
ncbi:MAG: hypothetical protein ACR5KW_01225 [Wolbachia sp.]